MGKLANTLKTDWLRVESRIREALRGWEKDGLTADSAPAALFLIDEILADETGRGNTLSE